jgi:hypothetical protein
MNETFWTNGCSAGYTGASFYQSCTRLGRFSTLLNYFRIVRQE